MVQVSIIVVTYNPDKIKLYRTLLSAVQQKDISFEVIISDDGSKEKDFLWIKDFFAKHNVTDYKILEHDHNQGTVKNILGAVDQACGKYVYSISPGDFFYDGYVLRDLYGYAEENNSVICFGNAVFYQNVEHGVKITRKYGKPVRPQLYSSKVSQKTRKAAFCGFDWIIGAAFFRERSAAQGYLRQISELCRYVEDSSSTAFAIAEGVAVQYFDRNVVWYEDGTGISTSGSTKWHDILINENKAFITNLKEMYPYDEYISVMHSCIINRNRFFRKIEQLVLHPIVSMRIYWQRLTVKPKLIEYSAKDIERLQGLLDSNI